MDQPGMRGVTPLRPTRRAVLLAPFLAATLRGADIQDRWTGVDRVVAIGDVHGDCDALIVVLKMASLVDDQAHWTGGKAHLVQVGDIPARGPLSAGIRSIARRRATVVSQAPGLAGTPPSGLAASAWA